MSGFGPRLCGGLSYKCLSQNGHGPRSADSGPMAPDDGGGDGENDNDDESCNGAWYGKGTCNGHDKGMGMTLLTGNDRGNDHDSAACWELPAVCCLMPTASCLLLACCLMLLAVCRILLAGG